MSKSMSRRFCSCEFTVARIRCRTEGYSQGPCGRGRPPPSLAGGLGAPRGTHGPYYRLSPCASSRKPPKCSQAPGLRGAGWRGALAYLDGHDGATLGVPHLLHHPIGSTAQLRDGHQVIGLHLKVLGGQKKERPQVRRAQGQQRGNSQSVRSELKSYTNHPLLCDLGQVTPPLRLTPLSVKWAQPSLQDDHMA